MSPSALPSTVTVAELRNVGLFGGVADTHLAHLVATLRVATPEAGEVLFCEGDDGREMFVVVEGEIEILKRSRNGTDVRVAMLGPGDWFGEMSILDIQPRSATVRTLAPTRLLCVTTRDLDRLYREDLRTYSLLTLNIARELSRRLRVADGIIAEIVANFLDGYVTPGR